MHLALLESFLSLYHDENEGVFRFHLLRCADWIDAQALTVETFLAAQQYFDPRKIGPGQKRIWLWQLAMVAQERRRGQIDGLAYSGEVLPSQAQLAEYARAVRLTAEWESTPQAGKDLLALFYAADFVPEELQAILGFELERVQDLLNRMVNAEQGRLVRALKPVGYFYNHLEGELRQRASGRIPGGRFLDGPRFWLARYRLRSALMWVFRFALLIGLTYLLLIAWHSYTRFAP